MLDLLLFAINYFFLYDFLLLCLRCLLTQSYTENTMSGNSFDFLPKSILDSNPSINYILILPIIFAHHLEK